jgi:2-polyprenyl-3-methyl-5-hydroxy-6-metoxy-1,4-benzoquinol methylase
MLYITVDSLTLRSIYVRMYVCMLLPFMYFYVSMPELFPLGTHEWRKFISPTELRMMVERPRGGDLILLQRMSGMVLRPHFLSESSSLSSIDIHQVKVLHWELSDDDLDVNYIIHAVKNKDKDGNRS